MVGCGGQGREIGRMLVDNGVDVVGYVDDQPSELNLARVAQQGRRYLGGRDSIGSSGATHYVIGIANGRVREILAPVAESNGLLPFTFVHPAATVGSDCVIGPGCVIWAGARLTTNVQVGTQVHINQNVTIGHDTTISDFVTINPSAAISGEVRLHRRVLIGASSVVLQGLDVASDAIVGASACAVSSVPPGAIAKGVPARWQESPAQRTETNRL